MKKKKKTNLGQHIVLSAKIIQKIFDQKKYK